MAADERIEAAEGPPATETTKLLGTTTTTAEITDDLPSSEDQDGIRMADAINIVWSKNAMVLAYVLIFLNFFVMSLEAQISGNLTPYVVSDFAAHSLIPALAIVSWVLSGVLKAPIARLVDTWGRPQGFALTTGLATLGLVLMATCNSIYAFALASVIRSIGFSGFGYILDVIIADTSSLANRALAFAFSSSPYILTTFVGPVVAQVFLRSLGWRWAFGICAVVVPVAAVPVYGVLIANARKAERAGVLGSNSPQKNSSKSVIRYALEYDLFGATLLSAGLVLSLLPFSVAGALTSNWTALPVLEVILGGLFLVAFVCHERFLAPVPFLPFKLLRNSNIFGAWLLFVALFIAFYCWDGYFTSYLQVVHGLSVADAGFIGSMYNLGSCFCSLFVGYLIRVTDRFKWLAWTALPLQTAGGVLMVFFRQPSTPIVFVIMCQVLIAVGGGTLVVTGQMAAMAVAQHGDVAALLALLSLGSAVGAGFGSAFSGAIWQSTVYSALLELLPPDARHRAADIYDNLELQLSYPVGSPIREAVIEAYGIAQKRMCFAGTLFFALAAVGVAMWKDIRVSQFKQVKGRVV